MLTNSASETDAVNDDNLCSATLAWSADHLEVQVTVAIFTVLVCQYNGFELSASRFSSRID
jgi:hypothetical protein